MADWLEQLGQLLLPEPKDQQQLIEVLRDAANRNVLNKDVLAMIEGALEVSELQTRDIMVPRAQMVTLQIDVNLDDLLTIVAESGHSRFPVISKSLDKVEGILLAKDLLKTIVKKEYDNFSLTSLLRPAVFVPESKRLDILLKEFRTKRNHMAIVADEYGGVAGLVTIEDVLEEIVGEIHDETDISDNGFIKKINEKKHIVKALIEIEEFNEYFGTQYSDEEFDTMGGLVINHFGCLPKKDDITIIGDMQFKILSADDRRVYLLEVTERS